MLKSNPKFSEQQTWYLARKMRGQSARCSGCLQKGKIQIGDLHLYVNGLLYLEKEDIVKVVKEMRFCINRKCVTEIQSQYNNIRPLEDFVVKKDPFLGRLTEEERANIQIEGFIVQGMPKLDFN